MGNWLRNPLHYSPTAAYSVTTWLESVMVYTAMDSSREALGVAWQPPTLESFAKDWWKDTNYIAGSVVHRSSKAA